MTDINLNDIKFKSSLSIVNNDNDSNELSSNNQQDETSSLVSSPSIQSQQSLQQQTNTPPIYSPMNVVQQNQISEEEEEEETNNSDNNNNNNENVKLSPQQQVETTTTISAKEPALDIKTIVENNTTTTDIKKDELKNKTTTTTTTTTSTSTSTSISSTSPIPTTSTPLHNGSNNNSNTVADPLSNKRSLEQQEDFEESIPKKQKNLDHTPSKVIHLRNLPLDCADQEIYSMVEPFGNIENLIIIKGKNQALVQMVELSSAVAFIQYYTTVQGSIRSKIIYAQYSNRQEISPAKETPNSILLVTISNYFYNVTIDELFKVFSHYGTILKILLFTKSGNYQSLIEMKTPEEASKAKSLLDGISISNSCSLKIQFSSLTSLKIKYNNEKSRDFTVIDHHLVDPTTGLTPPGLLTPPIPGSSSVQRSAYVSAPLMMNSPQQVAQSYQHQHFLQQQQQQQQQQHHGIIQPPSPLIVSQQPPQQQQYQQPQQQPPQNLYSQIGIQQQQVQQPYHNAQHQHQHHHYQQQQVQQPYHNAQQQSLLPTPSNQYMIQPTSPVNRAQNISPSSLSVQQQLIPQTNLNSNSSSASTQNGCVLIVAGLPLDNVSPDDLFTLFGIYGDPVRVKILYNHKDTALIQMNTSQQAELILQLLHSFPFKGHTIRVNLSKHKLVQLPRPGEDNGELTKDFTGSPMHRFKLPGSKNYQNIHPPSSFLHLSNLPDQSAGNTEEIEKKIRELFIAQGEIKSFKFFQNDMKMALIEMGSLEQAINSLVSIHGFPIMGDQIIKVSFAKPTARKQF